MNEVHDLAAMYVVDALSLDETHDFEAHLADCVGCREEVADMRSVAEHLSRSVQAEPPASLRVAVLAGITSTPQEPPVAVVDRAPAADNVVQLAPRSPSRLPYLIAAAAVLLALGFGGWGLQSHQDAQQATDQQTQIIQLLGARDVHTVTGTGPGGSSGTVVLSRASEKALFVANGMPALSGNKVYELWTITDTPVPAGTFRPGSNVTLVTLPAAALSANQIAVTVEPQGGSDQPTTTPVMSLSLPKAGS
jgi:anti-sigma-K factor RskA